MADSVGVKRNLRAAMKEALRIQDRFVAEPVFAKTGRGYLKSEGVKSSIAALRLKKGLSRFEFIVRSIWKAICFRALRSWAAGYLCSSAASHLS